MRLFGARIAGGGSGGVSAILGRSDATQSDRELTQTFHNDRASSTSDYGLIAGASIFGHLKLDLSGNEVSTTTR